MADIPIYPNPAGGSMTAANDADARAKGWTPAMGSFGVQTYPNGGGGGGGGGGAPTQPAGNPDLAGYVAAMQASSGFSIKELEEKKREFDATLEWQKEQWRQQGLPELAIKQRAQDLEDAKFRELTDQAHFTQNLQTRQQDLSEKVQLGQLSVAQAQQQLAREIQTGQLRVSQGQLGLDTLKTAASLSGPADWLKSLNFSRGVADTAGLPDFVNRLLTGQSTAALGGPAVGAVPPPAATLQTIAGGMGAPQAAMGAPAQMGASAMDAQHMADFYARAVAAANTGGTPAATGSPAPAGTTTPAPATPQYATAADVATTFGRTPQPTQADATIAGLQKLYAQGGQALAPQQWEGLLKSEKDAAIGGMATLGGDTQSWLEQQARSRIGQKAATPAAAGV